MGDRNIKRDLEAIHPACFGWAMACCDADREEAEEVLQTSYLKALDGRARFDGLSSLRTWFFGVVKRTAAEGRRRRLARSFGLERWRSGRPVPRAVPTPESLSRDAADRQLLRSLLANLSRRQRDLLHLVFYQEMTVEESASVLGVSVGTARTHYERGKARLRAMLAKVERDDEDERQERRRDSRTVLGGQAGRR